MTENPGNRGEPSRLKPWPTRVLNNAPVRATTAGVRAVASSRSVLVALILGIILFTGGVSTTEAQIAQKEITGLTLSSDSPGTLHVSWEQVSPKPTDHRVNWGKTSEGFPGWREADGNAYPETNSYTITGLEQGVEYKVHVRARYSEESPGPWSETVTLVVAGTPAPATPTGLTGTVKHDRVSLSWDDPQDDSITGYQILRRDRSKHPAGVFEIDVDDTGSADTAYTDTDVEVGTQYVYRIKARNAGGLSRRSGYFDANIPQPPQVTASFEEGAYTVDEGDGVTSSPSRSSYSGPGPRPRERDHRGR